MSIPQNRTYRAWENVELPIYFLKLHETAPTVGLRIQTILLVLSPRVIPLIPILQAVLRVPPLESGQYRF